MFMLGSIVNAAAVALCGILGALLKKGKMYDSEESKTPINKRKGGRKR